MTLHTFPKESRARWRRLDVPGREEACVERTSTGWRLTGELDVEETGLAARLRYAIECDPEWRTRSAQVEGEAGGAPIRFALAADGAGQWTRDGTPLPELSGALDVDLGFTPATNTLPIRRLGLAVGERAPVRSAWLRFPELRLEPLEQTYTREAEQTFRYRALVDGEPFIARLDTDEFGRVVRYEGLWELELAMTDGAAAADSRYALAAEPPAVTRHIIHPMKMNKLVPMLPVRSMPASVDFYEKLGFSTEKRNDSWRWAMLCLGECRLMVDESINVHPGVPRTSVLYLYPDDISEFHEQVRRNGLVVPDLEVTFYGMTEFRIDDPDGNRLWIGQDAPTGT